MKYNYTDIPRDGLVWEGLLDGNALDTSGNGNNGTATNVTYVSADRGYVEQVGSFGNTSTSKVTIPYSTNINFNPSIDDYTYSMWIKNNDTTKNTYYIINTTDGNFADGYHIYFDNAVGASSFRVNINDGSTSYLSNQTPITQGEYFLATCVVTGGVDYKVYVNGVLSETVSLSGIASFTSGDGITLGNTDNLDRRLYGKIGLARIYNRALSQDEITNLYLEGLRRLGPARPPHTSQTFPVYSLPTLENGKVLEISKAQSGGQYIDQSGNGNSSTSVVSVTDSTVGKYNVMSFNPTNTSFISINTPPANYQQDFTICATFQINVLNTDKNIYGSTNNTDFRIHITDTNRARFSIFSTLSNQIIGNIPIITGKLYRIVGVRSKTSGMKLFLDGVLEGTNSFVGNGQSSTGNDRIGMHTPAFNVYMNGNILNVKMYNRALLDEEVLQDYYAHKIA